MFNKDKEPLKTLQFKSRAEAFNYMLTYLLNEKKIEPAEAAKQANEFAEIFAINMGIPLQVEPELKGVDKYISIAQKIGNYLSENPKIIEYGIPAITFIAGLFTGKKVEEAEDRRPPYQSIRKPFADGQEQRVEPPIDFSKID